MTKISVVLPVFNAKYTIRRAIESVLQQTLSPAEVIVVDDGSTDGTLSVLQSIKDPRLRVIQQAHLGVEAAANTGTRLATCPLIARMDADDFSYPARLERQSRWLHDHQLDVVGCQVQIVDEQGAPSDSLRRYTEWINNETLDSDSIMALRFVELPIVNPTILARREYFELEFHNNGFPEDYDLLLRAAEKGMTFGKVNEVLFDWTDGATRLTRTHENFSDAAFMQCRRTHLLTGPLASVGTVDLWGVGKAGKPWISWLLQNGIQVRRAYDVNKKKIGTTIHGVAIHSPAELLHDGMPIIIAVGAEGARATIWPQLVSRGFVPGQDAWFVA